MASEKGLIARLDGVPPLSNPGEAEQLGQRLGSRSDGVAGADRVLRLDVQDELVEVGALPGTGRVDTVAHLEDRRVDRVDRDLTGLGVLVAVLRRRDVATATLDRELELALRGLVEGRDDEPGVVNLDTGRSRDVSRGHFARSGLTEVSGDGPVALARDPALLDV